MSKISFDVGLRWHVRPLTWREQNQNPARHLFHPP